VYVNVWGCTVLGCRVEKISSQKEMTAARLEIRKISINVYQSFLVIQKHKNFPFWLGGTAGWEPNFKCLPNNFLLF